VPFRVFAFAYPARRIEVHAAFDLGGDVAPEHVER